MSRLIVLDTETTGLSPENGDRVIEIGCVELLNRRPTGANKHFYLNPERPNHEDAVAIHGLTDEFLADKPKFAEKADEFLEFILDATLVIHNAPFDMGFLNYELEKIGRPSLRNEVIDTVMVARNRHPGARVSLDALCKHYGIDTSKRVLHGALLDSEILADVYLELIGGKQVSLALVADTHLERGASYQRAPARQRPMPLARRISAAEIEAHFKFIAGFGADAMWKYYEDAVEAAE